MLDIIYQQLYLKNGKLAIKSIAKIPNVDQTFGGYFSGTTPAVGSSPTVGFSPTNPHTADGIRIDPPVSVPSVASAMPAATLTADPPLEPPGDRLTS